MVRAGIVQTALRLFILQSAFLAAAQARTCYLTNGKEADSSFQPCFPDQDESFCCSIAKANDVANDICLTGGVCYVQDPYYRGLLRQGACTDSTWKSSQCPSLSDAVSNATLYVIPCPLQGRGFWCASNGTDCCHNAARLDMGQMVNVTVTSLSGSTSSSYSSPSATSSPSSPSDTAASSQSATCTSEINCPNLKKNTAVAAGVGAALGACLLIALITLLMQRRIYTKNMRNKEATINALKSAGAQPHQDDPVDAEVRKRTFPVELGPPDAWIHEVHGNHS